mgnify:CR=1 FL=1|jgi:Protein of unknown function (DUF2874).
MKLKVVTGLAAALAAVLSAEGQTISQRAVPAVVLNTFQQQFPGARQAEWEKRRDGSYEVEFHVGLFGRDHNAYISNDGKLLVHEEEVASSSLPVAVKDRIRTDFAEYSIEDVKKVTSGNQVIFKVELDSRSQDLHVEFHPDGTVKKELRD